MSTTITPSLKDLASRVTVTSKPGASLPYERRDDWQKSAHDYRVTLRYQGRSMSLDFFMGSAITEEPDAAGVLECLLSGASALDETFESWCGEFGYDTDSRKALSIYRQCRTQGAALRRVLGEDFETFRNADRD